MAAEVTGIGMPNLAPAASDWLDVQGLAALKTQAAQQSPQALAAVAQQFESLFVGMMLKSMRDAKLGDGLFDSDQTKFYQDLYDQQLATTLAQGKGLGIAELIVRSLSAHATPAGAPLEQGRATRLRPRTPAAPEGSGAAALATVASAGAPSGPPAEAQPEPSLWDSPQAFIEFILPHAQAAAASLGVSPQAILAQAALETNWGRQVPGRDGGSSHNLFGIKAGGRWTGPTVAKDTLEYEGGVATRRRQPFRAYDSLAHAFLDYVDLLKGNARYAQALKVGQDPECYVKALQEAGYATDPAYSQKIAAILRSEPFRTAVDALKCDADPPIF